MLISSMHHSGVPKSKFHLRIDENNYICLTSYNHRIFSKELAVATTSIWMPVYNEIRFIRQTLLSIQGQADEIIIYDNNSSDGTSEICKKFADDNNNVIYKEQEQTVSGLENFNAALAMASGDYIMMLGGHDMISKNYVEALKNILDKNPDAVSAFTNCVNISANYNFINYYSYYFHKDLSSKNPATRVLGMLENLSSASLYMGLYRKHVFTETLKNMRKLYRDDIVIDTSELMEHARLGRMMLCPDATLFRMQPREPVDAKEFAIHVLKGVKGNNYDPASDIPELLPISFAKTILDTALKVADYALDKKVFLQRCCDAIIRRCFSELGVIKVKEIIKEKGIAYYPDSAKNIDFYPCAFCSGHDMDEHGNIVIKMSEVKDNIFCGPYQHIPPGKWVAKFLFDVQEHSKIDIQAPSLRLDCVDKNFDKYFEARIPFSQITTQNEFEFSIPAGEPKSFELRAFAEKNCSDAVFVFRGVNLRKAD